MILSFIDGRTFEECVEETADSLGTSESLIENFIESLTDNPNQIKIKSKGTTSVFPPRTIVTVEDRTLNRRYSPEMFAYSELDMKMKRHLTPSTITLMLNNVCVTKCIYCYQDKSRMVNCTIPLDRIISLIQEAKQLHVNSFDVIGGEFFLYPHWREVLAELRSCGYNPYISTKKPLGNEEVDFLKKVNLRDIQISLDSMIPSHLSASIGVPDRYIEEMLSTISLLDQAGISITVHSVLTRYNMTVEDMESVFKLISGFRHVVDWHIVKGEPTLYPQVPYEKIEIPSKEMNRIVDYLDSLPENLPFSINKPQREFPDLSSLSRQISLQEKERRFFRSSRTFCSGLFSSLYILPDGNVTMCEQLYWNKDFIVGNILENSIMEIWNSDKALSIYNLDQSSIPEDSLCHSCKHFSECRAIRQVCYREIIRKYGKEKWYYPDVNCPYAGAD